MPNVLIIHLQRIVFNLDTFLNDKMNNRVEFPNHLSLAPYMRDPDHQTDFTLKGVVVHRGTAQFGHYYSYIAEGDHWLEFNDSLVRDFDPK